MNVLTIVIGLDPVAFRLGPIAVHWYGLGYVLAIAVAAWVSLRIAPYFGADTEELWNVFPWAIVTGLIGGRLYFVVQNDQSYYLHHPQHILAAWEGGMAFFGAIIAVILTMIVFARVRGLSMWPFLDVAAIFAAVGQPFGRLGNIVNGDIVGYPTHLPWGTAYTNPHALAPALNVPYQPAAVYEILCNLALIAVLWFVLRRWRPAGAATALYITGYAVTQFLVFFWRANSVTALGLKQAQLTALVALAAGLALLWWRWRAAGRDDAAAGGSATPAGRPARRGT